LEDHAGSTNKEDEEDHDPGIGDNAVLDDDVDENMLKVTLMTMMISPILSTPFLNRIMI
jgi:hypothetical protein